MAATEDPAAARTSEGVIPEEIARFVSSGVSVAMATCDAELNPHGARGAAVMVDADRCHVTVFVQSASARRILRDLERHPRAAVLFVRPTDDKACQLKGTFLGSRRARASEREDVERQGERFLAGLDAIGIARSLTAGWTFWPCVAVRLRVSEVFDQTPGPGAGGRL